MEEEQGAAPSEAAVDEAIAGQVVADEGQQAEAAPPAGEAEAQADADTEEEGRSKSAERRERKKLADARIREERDMLREKLARYEAQVAAEKRPVASDFTDPDEYLAELAAYGAAKRIAKDRIDETGHEIRRIEQAERRQQIDAFEASARQLAAQYPDFESARSVAANPRIVSHALSEMILDSGAAAHLAYHLGKNPTEAIELSQLGPLAMARRVAALEARFTLPKPKTATSAPAPIRPVSPSGTAMKDPEKMSNDEYRAARRSGAIR